MAKLPAFRRIATFAILISLIITAAVTWIAPLPSLPLSSTPLSSMLRREPVDPARRITIPSPADAGWSMYPPPHIMDVLIPPSLPDDVRWDEEDGAGAKFGPDVDPDSSLFKQCKAWCGAHRACKEVTLLAPNKIFRVQHTLSGKCWRPLGDKLILGDCSEPDTSFRWEGTTLQHIKSGKCIHPTGGAALPDKSLVLWEGCDEERLRLTLSPSGIFMHSPSLCVHTKGGHDLVYARFCTQPYTLIPACHMLGRANEEEVGDVSKDVIRSARKTVIHSKLPFANVPPVRKNHELDKQHQAWVDRTSPPRSVPFDRVEACLDIAYNFPPDWTTSIIMCYRNEPIETLMASIKTIMFRTPPRMVDEIILIDEASDHPQAVPVSEVRGWGIPKVTVVRNEKPNGLMRCRMQGADIAKKSPVLIFLDSHIEVEEGWLEPLLQAAQIYGSSVVPVVDIIEHVKDDEYSFVTAGDYNRGSADWEMIFTSDFIPTEHRRPRHVPFIDPVMIGGLFAISRTRWEESGQYDQLMEVWGAENLEMSFREWMCGGQIYVTPCSRVGHVYKKKFRYEIPHNTVNRNNERTAMVWMDEFARTYTNDKIVKEDVRERLKLRQRLKCKDFRWYLDHVNHNLRDLIPEEWKYLLNSTNS